MNTIYKNTLEEDLSCSVFEDKINAHQASIWEACIQLRNETESETGEIQDPQFFGENSELFKELAQQIIEAVDGKFVKEYKLKGTK